MGDPGFELVQRASPEGIHLFIQVPAEQIIGPNFYEFVHNNPVGLTDPYGLHPVLWILGGIGVGFIAWEAWHGFVVEGCHSLKVSDDARAQKIKKCLASGEDPADILTPINNPADPAGFRKFCVSLGLYK